MNDALLSSKKMDYCTPQSFFDAINEEFHFSLDAAATHKSAKCPAYFTPEDDGLKRPWTLAGGVLYSATRHTGARLESGSAKHTRKRRTERLSCCLSPPERTRPTFTTTSTATRRSASCAGGSTLRTRMGRNILRHRSPLCWSFTTEKET